MAAAIRYQLLSRMLKGGLIFGLLGPIIGMASFLIFVGLALPDESVLDALLLLAFFPLAYVIVGIPSAITGFAAGLIQHCWPLRKAINRIFIVFLAVLIGISYQLLLYPTDSSELLFVLGLWHAISSFCCVFMVT